VNSVIFICQSDRSYSNQLNRKLHTEQMVKKAIVRENNFLAQEDVKICS